MAPGSRARLGTTDLSLPTDLFKHRLADTISYARSQRRESWWYSPWTEALTYLCLATSAGVAGSGIYDTERGRGASFYLCPQKELLRNILRPQSGGGLVADKRNEIILWNAQVEDPPEETYPTDTNFVDVDPEPGPELEEDDLAEHPSFARTDDSDSSKLKENIRQPDFVVLAKAFDAPLHCHSVWEVKTFFSYSTNHKKDPKGSPQSIARIVMDSAIPQVSAQVIHAFHEHPTQDTAHCFILVDVYYRRLEYERRGIPLLRSDMKNDDIIKLANNIKPKILGPISTALQKSKDETGKGVFWFTMGFENAWRECTRDFMKRN